ncbi:uncharacterized protein MELLADRAFT_112194 [Melampsora larici-populina 98AG31]|uniref:Uncharacterized protein n=1 Tax=Melampsora larici-populina (strain 98AG31 / pathotype 3-4-7) TaxID=747676 RepID=F4S5N8_MELLP|nr:uncharacterized protein MELLADRAFT_112194 [Melampsora larici-populina 98AG31]EGG00077.1 hypothetical protein MELLADRAFT_112194 [Melampsora larici-populina 98AG31]
MNYFLPSNSLTSYHHHHQKQKQKQQNQSSSAKRNTLESHLDHHETSNIEDWTQIELNSTSTSNHPSSSSDIISTNPKETETSTNIRTVDSPITNLDQSQLISKLLPNEDHLHESQVDSLTDFDPQAWKRGEEVTKDHSSHYETLKPNLIPISNQLKKINIMKPNELESKLSYQIPVSSSSNLTNLNKPFDEVSQSSNLNQPSNSNLPRWRPYLSISRRKSKTLISKKPIDEIPIKETKVNENQIPKALNKPNPKKENEEEDDDQSVKNRWFKIDYKTLKFIGISSLVIIFGIGIGTKKRINLNKFKSMIFKSFKPLSIF